MDGIKFGSKLPALSLLTQEVRHERGKNERDYDTAFDGFFRIVWVFHLFSAQESPVAGGFSGRPVYLGMLSSGDGTDRTYFYCKSDCDDICGDLFGSSGILEKSAYHAFCDSFRGAPCSGKLALLYDERCGYRKYGGRFLLRNTDAAVCAGHCSRDLCSVDIGIYFEEIRKIKQIVYL